MKLSIIVAVAENGVIGRENSLIWRLSADLKRFKQLTMGHPMIMGRKTFESIGKPLPGRTSIVITRQKDFHPEGVVVAYSLQEAIACAKSLDAESAFVIGGGEIYRQALPYCNQLFITRVMTDVEGDTYFHLPDLDLWNETFSAEYPADDKNEFSYKFLDLEKK
ncbi:dihydrofolate reductase [Dyadobacter tibetensis]|uniref:dihydrofolate reductase n=1 Tax=Dyadobacter tibetensis TaxID=1211851 RepID=UPI0004722023|nr:dihydrofolate reductase [Dyadobacter tibetensis]